MGKFTNNLNNRIEATSSKYHRKLFQTFLTAPEWRNVEMSEEFANFLKEGKSFHQFPYFKEIMEFWRIFNNSYQAARKYNGRLEIISSDYMFMNIFIGLFSSLFSSAEYIIKGLFSFRPQNNLFRYGFDFIRELILNPFRRIVDFRFCLHALIPNTLIAEPL